MDTMTQAAMTSRDADTPSDARPVSPDILLVTELYPPAIGGSAVLFENVYGRLEHESVVVLADADKSAGPDSKRGKVWIERGPLAYDIWGLMSGRALRHHWGVASQIKRIGKRGSTIVHCGRTLPEGLGAWLARMRGGPAYACWAHGEDITMQMTTSREMAMLTRRIWNGSRVIFANSRNTARICEDADLHHRRVEVVYPGTDVERFKPGLDAAELRARYAPPDAPLMLSIGRFERRKGFDLSIRAVAKLRDALPDLRYVIVGGGPDDEYLRDLIESEKVGDRVTMAGRVPNEELPLFYSACDLFVHPNRIEGVDVEGFGIVFMEAAASERAVIGGDNGGVPEAVARDETGLLVSGTDLDELAAAIKRLVDSPELRERLGKAGRQRVVDSFTWDVAARRMAQIHQETKA